MEMPAPEEAIPEAGNIADLIDRLLALGREVTWVEVKHNNSDPREIGEYLSALSNAAALEGRRRGYIIWGIADDLSVVGTDFDPLETKINGQELENWLLTRLSPQIFFRFHSLKYRDEPLVLLEVAPASERPIRFNGEEFIRIGSYKKRLKQHPDHERRLWRLFDTDAFENAPALSDLSVEQVIQVIDYPAFFHLTRTPLPENRSLILEYLEQAGIISYDVSNDWSISNRGALLFAVNLGDFPALARKAMRVVQYEGTSRIKTLREQVGQKGYAPGFQGLVGYVSDLLPQREVIDRALRSAELMYPEFALRELIANALIHQDLTIPGSGPMVEIFDDRLEITNPGIPLIQPDRFIDSPPQSRNERLARSMRQMGFCEERGSGWDKVTFEIEYHQLPPPLVEVTEVHTRVVLFAPRPLASMERDDRIRAIYQHACLRYVNREPMTNTTVRQRFGIPQRNSALASRLIREAVEAEVITPYDPSVGFRSMRYVPVWADPARSSFS